MKKFLSLALCLVLCLCFAACSEKKENKSSHPIDIVYYAKNGRISDLNFKLGDRIDEVEEILLKAGTDEHGDPILQEPIELGEYTLLSTGEILCVYETENVENGITHIAYLNGAYGFDKDTAPNVVKDVMSDMGHKASERAVKPGELFFIPGGNAEGNSVLEYTLGDHTLLFVFNQNALSGAIIY